MPSYNLTVLLGNLTRDPESFVSKSGSVIASMNIAINRTYNVANERKKETTYVSIKAFGKVAETIMKYCHSGDLLMVQGRLSTEEWTDKTSGQKREKLVVICDNIQLMGGNKDGGTQESEQRAEPSQPKSFTPPPRRESMPQNVAPIPDDDVPF